MMYVEPLAMLCLLIRTQKQNIKERSLRGVKHMEVNIRNITALLLQDYIKIDKNIFSIFHLYRSHKNNAKLWKKGHLSIHCS